MSETLKRKLDALEKRIVEKALSSNRAEEIEKNLVEYEELTREREAYWDKIGLTAQQRAEIQRQEISEVIEWYNSHLKEVAESIVRCSERTFKEVEK
jgi:hypothetical protein